MPNKSWFRKTKHNWLNQQSNQHNEQETGCLSGFTIFLGFWARGQKACVNFMPPLLPSFLIQSFCTLLQRSPLWSWKNTTCLLHWLCSPQILFSEVLEMIVKSACWIRILENHGMLQFRLNTGLGLSHHVPVHLHIFMVFSWGVW